MMIRLSNSMGGSTFVAPGHVVSVRSTLNSMIFPSTVTLVDGSVVEARESPDNIVTLINEQLDLD